MACDAQTLITLAYSTNKFGQLSKRDLMLCLAAVYGVKDLGWTASFAITQAVGHGYLRLSKRDLFASLLAAICGGSGGGPAVPAPTNLDISNSSTNGNTILTWSQGSAPTNNLIELSIDGNPYGQIGSVPGASTTFTDVTVIPDGGLYRYRVRAQTGANTSDPSATVAVASNYNHNNDNLTSISIPDLIICYGNFLTSNETLLTILSVPSLRKVLGNFSTVACSVLTAFNSASLLSTGGVFQVAGCALLTSITVTSLVSVGAAFDCSNSALTSLSLPAFTTCILDFSVSSSPGLVTVTANSLTSITGNLLGIGCTTLTTVSMANVIYTDGNTVDFTLTNLSAASVNQILARGVATLPGGMTFNLSGPTLAAPTGQGIADAATLQGLGNTVNTN